MKNRSIAINEEKCKQDGLCAKICPMSIFIHKEEEYPRIKNVEHCVLCGQCIAVCPHDAIEHTTLPTDQLIKISNQHPVNDEAMMAILRQRRSVRVYKDKKVPREVLEEIAQCCGYCPTGAHGGEGWVRNVTVVTGRENLRSILEYTVEYMKVMKKMLEGVMVKLISRWSPEARGGLSTLPDLTLRLEEYEQGRDVILYNAPAMLLVHAPNDIPTPQEDSHAALYGMMLLAEAKGLGTCWMGWVQKAAAGFKVRSFTALREFLRVPERHNVYSAMTIGYPAVKLHSLPPRVTRVTWIENGNNLS